MVAAPFKAVLKFVNSRGQALQYACTVSDVNAAFYVFQDGQNQVTLPATMGTLFLTDVILSAAGTDTSQGVMYVNGRRIPERVMNAANVATNLSRQFMGAPVPIAGGANFRIEQLT